MSEANVNLTIYIRDKTVDIIMPYLKWALDNKLEATVSFEVLKEEEISRATDFSFDRDMGSFADHQDFKTNGETKKDHQ